jgi:hypothetical protein
MRFKEWLLLHENIVVNTGSGEASLGKSRENNNVVEFSYGAGDYYSSFEVWPFSEERPGYVKLSDGAATVVGIIKKTPIEAGNGADRAFIKSLAASLAASGLKPLPYKEGDSAWMGAMSAAGVDDDHPAMKGMKGEKEFSSTSTPEMGKTSANAKKATAGVSFSRMSGSWAYFMRVNPGSAAMQIEKIVGAMKKAAQPLIDNDIIEHYSIVKGWNYGGAETVWSKRGKQEHDDDATKIKKSSSYIKFLADKMLANHPKAREQVYKYFRHSWDKDTTPENTKVPLDELVKYINWQHNESPFLTFFIEALKGDSQHMYEVMEEASKTQDADDAIRLYKEIHEEEYSYMVENPRLWMSNAIRMFSISPLLSKHASGNYERFKREYEEAINSWLESGETIRPGDIEYLKKLAEHINIRGKDQIEDAHKKIKTREEEDEKKREEKEAMDRDTIGRGSFKYMQVGTDTSWKDVPLKYLDGDDVEVSRLALDNDIVDKEEVFGAAHEKASEEAYANAEERKSETYGQDREEVESDIDYEWDEYIEDRFSEGEWDGTSEEDAKKEIKDDYFDDFVDWKKDRLKKEEEEESWKYEPEADESDVWKYEKEIAEEKAYEDGLVIFKWPEDSNDLEVWLHSKHFSKARESVRRSVSASIKNKDEHGEPVLRGWQDISFTFVDKGSGEGEVIKASNLS